MSRCFPYPPPGYSLNTAANNEALIESIKLRREREKKKEKKREKKERRREEKKSSNPGLHECLFKCLEDEAEQLERSYLTEEHGQAVCSQNSSDSTQNSSKRKRPAASPSHGNNIQVAHGSIIRIRLSKKGETSTNNQGCPAPSGLEPSPSTSGWRDRVAAENSVEFQYRNLIENWLPPTLQTEHLDVDNEAWLFQRKPKHARVGEKSAVSNDSTCGSSSLWPRAQYIQDAQLYALPFTVPF